MAEVSVARIVGQIIETLTDSVSQLVVLVVALQEQNAPPPAALPASANGVAKAAEALVQVARSLAQDEYADYPDIAQQINAAAGGVEGAAAGLIQAVNNLQTSSNRQGAWDHLVDACKVISGKTILLLQIVYGAELQRLFAAADIAIDALRRLDAEQAASDPQAFADQAGEGATKLNQLSEYVRAKARDADSPLVQEQLEAVAEQLSRDAQDLIEDANGLLQDCDNPRKKQKFEETLARAKEATKKSVLPLEEELERANRDLETLRGASQGESNYDALFPRAAQKSLTDKKPQEGLKDEEVLAAVSREAALGDALEDASARGDRSAVEEALRAINNANNELIRKAQQVAKDSDDPHAKQQLLDALQELENLLPEQKNAASRASAAPRDHRAQEGLKDVNHKVKDALADLAQAVRPGAGAGAITDEEANQLETVREAALGGDVAALEDALRGLQDLNAMLSKQAAKAADEPNKKKELNEALHALDALLPLEMQAAKKVHANPHDKTSQRQLDDVEEQLKDALNAINALVDPNPENELLAAVGHEEKECKKLADAAKKGDKQALANAAQNLNRLNSEVNKQGRALAEKEYDPSRKREILDAVAELDRLLPEQLSAASAAASVPRDKAKQEDLDDVNNQVMHALAQVEKAVQPEAPLRTAAKKQQQIEDKVLRSAAGAEDPKFMPKAVDDLEKANDELLWRAHELQNDRSDPLKKMELAAAIDQLANLVPDQNKAARTALERPRDTQAQKQLNDISRKVDDAVSDLLDAAKPSSADLADRDKHNALCELDRLLEALRNGDLASAADAEKDANNHLRKLAGEGRAEARRTLDPKRKKELYDAIAELENMIPAQMEATREAMAAPHDKRKQQRLEETNEKLKDAMDNLVDAMYDTPDEALAAAAHRVAKDAATLEGASKEQDTKGVEKVAKQLARATPKLVEQAKVEAVGTKDPLRKRELLTAVEELESLLPQQIKAAKEVTQNPSDKQKQRQLEDKTMELEDTLRSLAESLAPVEHPEEAILRARNAVESAGPQIIAAAKIGDNAGLNRALNSLEDAVRRMGAAAKQEAANTDDPITKRELNELVDALEDLSKQLRPDAIRAVSNPRDKAAQDKLEKDVRDLQDIADRLVGIAKAQPTSETGKLHNILNDLKKSSNRDDADLKRVADDVVLLARHSPKIVQAAKLEIAKQDPSKRQAAHEALEELERMLPETIAASLQRVKNPRDKKAQESLQDAIGHHKSALDELHDAMKPDSKGPVGKFLDAAVKEKDDLDVLQEEVARGNAEAVNRILPALHHDHDDAKLKLAKIAAEERNPKKKEGLVHAVEELKDALPKVEAAAKKAARSPQDKAAQKELQDSAASVQRQLDAAVAAVAPERNASKDEKLGRAVNAITAAAPKVIEVVAKLRRNPADNAARNELQAVGEQLREPVHTLKNKTAQPRTNDQDVIAKANNERVALKDLLEAARNLKPINVPHAASKSAAAQEELINVAEDAAARANDPVKRKRIQDAIADLERLLPQKIKAAQKVAADPADYEAQNELGATSEEMNDAIERIKDAVYPRKEQALLKAADDIHEHGEKLKDASQKGDRNSLDDHLRALLNAADEVLDKAVKAAEEEEDHDERNRLADTISRLEDMLKKLQEHGNQAKNNPRDRKAQSDLADDVKRLEDAVHRAIEQSHAEPIAEAHKEAAALESLSAAARRGDAKEVAESAKAVAASNAKLVEQARAHSSGVDDPTRKRELLDSIGELEALLPKQINAAKEALLNPNDPLKQHKLQEIVDDYEARLAAAADFMRPTKEHTIEALTKNEEANLAKVEGAAKAGDPQAVQNALSDVKAVRDKLVDKARQIAGGLDDDKQSNLLDAIQELERTLRDLDGAAADAARNPRDNRKQAKLSDTIHKIKAPLQDIREQTSEDTAEPLIADPAARAARVLAALKAAKGRQVDPKTFLEAAEALAKYLSGLANDVNLQAYKGQAGASARAKAALDLNSMLQEIEAAARGGPSRSNRPAASVDAIIGDLENLAAASKAPAKAGSLEESINHVAENIKQAHRIYKEDAITGQHTSNIGRELSKLAQACKGGQRQQFLISARTIAGFVNALYSDIMALAKKVPDRELQDRLIKCAQALKNFSIQLKILASVKAASNTPDPDAEHQLKILTQNFGNMLSSTISNVSVVRIKYPQLA